MDPKQWLEQAQTIEQELINKRRYLHEHPGCGFDIQETYDFVKQSLEDMGYTPKSVGKMGLVASIGSGEPVFLLRADMDALPITEDSGLDFAAINGRMHACGHDFHTTMLLGAAKLLKMHEDEIHGTIKLMFQAAEEIFQGSKDMIDNGLLKNPDVDAAMMIHVMAGMPMPAGTVIISSPGVSAPAADTFEITVKGIGCHGSMPNTGRDPLLAACYLVLALEEIQTRELGMKEEAVLTFGSFNGGNVPNVIPDSVKLTGSLRTMDEDVRSHIKTRMDEIAKGFGQSFRVDIEIHYMSGCPTLKNDEALSRDVEVYTRDLLGPAKAFTVNQLMAMSGGAASKTAGSEDFAYVSQEVPSVMLALAAGEPSKGYKYPQHHPQVKFDESVLAEGSAVYAYNAVRWLDAHQTK